MNYNNLSLEDLQEICRNYGYDVVGKSKEELIAMLGGAVEDEVKESEIKSEKLETSTETSGMPAGNFPKLTMPAGGIQLWIL